MKSNFYIYVIILLVVVFFYLSTTKEGIVFTNKVDVQTILNNPSIPDNKTRLEMIEQIKISDKIYTDIINKQIYCNGNAPRPNAQTNNGKDCDDARVNALNKLFSIPDKDYSTSLNIYAITTDNTINNTVKISMLQKIKIDPTTTNTQLQNYNNELKKYAKCIAEKKIPVHKCINNHIKTIRQIFNR